MQSGSNGRHRRSARYDAPIQRPAAVPDSVPSSTMARQDAGQPAQPYYPQTNWPAPPAGYTQRGYGQQQGSQAQPAGQAMPGSQAMPAAQTAPVQPYYYQQQPQSQIATLHQPAPFPANKYGRCHPRSSERYPAGRTPFPANTAAATARPSPPFPGFLWKHSHPQ